MKEMYSILSVPYYKSNQQCYVKVLTLDRDPPRKSILNKILKKTNFQKISPFKELDNCERNNNCRNIFINPYNNNEFAEINDIPAVFTWLHTNNYFIDTNITQMFNNGTVRMTNPVIAFISK
ncbi:hypothetical protein N9O88_01395 [bacterium]|nr:hypothetical protein [bacterium]